MKNTEGVPRGRGLAAPRKRLPAQYLIPLATANIVTLRPFFTFLVENLVVWIKMLTFVPLIKM